MNGYIIYSIVDVNKNRSYIEMNVNKFQKYGVKLELMIVEEIENMSLLTDYNKFTAYFNNTDFVINRSRNHKVAAAFEKMGVRVFNSSKVTEIANNKGMSYKFLKNTVPFLPIYYKEEIVNSGIDEADTKFEYPYIIKSCAGHGGSQVFMVNNEEEMQKAVQEIGTNEYVIQKCCSDLGKDVRVYIIGNKVVAAMLRESMQSFKSNYSLGGKVRPYTLNECELKYVDKITKKLPMDFAGIDFTFHNGKAVFNEIEDAAGARMLYANTDMDIVELFVQYVIKTMNA